MCKAHLEAHLSGTALRGLNPEVLVVMNAILSNAR